MKPDNVGKPPSSTPSQSEFGLFRAFLAQGGYSPQQIADSVGLIVNGRNWGQIESNLSNWINKL